MIRVLIVEDHESMREAITGAFTATQRYQIVGEVGNANFAELFCQRLQPDLVLMDVCTEGGASGLTAAQTIKERFPETKVIIMTAFDELSYIPRARAAGADGFVYKSRSLQFFVETADRILAGEQYFPEQRTVPVSQGEVPLSDREMEVLRLMCKHMSNEEIANELFISESTVRYHKANMLAKTGFSKSMDLAFYMISNGFINPLY